jgi:hypothetical protein
MVKILRTKTKSLLLKKSKSHGQDNLIFLQWKMGRMDYAINFRLAYAFFYRLLYMGLGFREKEY